MRSYNLRSPKEKKYPHQRGYMATVSQSSTSPVSRPQQQSNVKKTISKISEQESQESNKLLAKRSIKPSINNFQYQNKKQKTEHIEETNEKVRSNQSRALVIQKDQLKLQNNDQESSQFNQEAQQSRRMNSNKSHFPNERIGQRSSSRSPNKVQNQTLTTNLSNITRVIPSKTIPIQDNENPGKSLIKSQNYQLTNQPIQSVKPSLGAQNVTSSLKFLEQLNMAVQQVDPIDVSVRSKVINTQPLTNNLQCDSKTATDYIQALLSLVDPNMLNKRSQDFSKACHSLNSQINSSSIMEKEKGYISFNQKDTNINVNPQNSKIFPQNQSNQDFQLRLNQQPSQHLDSNTALNKYSMNPSIKKPFKQNYSYEQLVEYQNLPLEELNKLTQQEEVQNQEGQDDADFQPKRRYKKFTHADRIGKTAGRWTRQEHIRFMQAIKLFGKDWKKVEDFIGTRTGAQIRSHAQKYFQRVENEGQKQDSDKDSNSLKSDNENSQKDKNDSDQFHSDQVMSESDQENQNDHQNAQIQPQIDIQEEHAEVQSPFTRQERVQGEQRSMPKKVFEEDKKLENHKQNENQSGIEDDKVSLRTESTGGLPSQVEHNKPRDRIYSIPSDFSTSMKTQIRQQTHHQAIPAQHQQQSQDPTPQNIRDSLLKRLTSINDSSLPMRRSNQNENNLDWTTQTFNNLQKIQQQRFVDIVKKKERLMGEMYTTEKDIYIESERYQQQLAEMVNEVQQLAQLNQALQKTFCFTSNNQTSASSQFFEKILIFLADISNMQKVLEEFVENVNLSLNNIMIGQATQKLKALEQIKIQQQQKAAANDEQRMPTSQRLQHQQSTPRLGGDGSNITQHQGFKRQLSSDNFYPISAQLELTKNNSHPMIQLGSFFQNQHIDTSLIREGSKLNKILNQQAPPLLKPKFVNKPQQVKDKSAKALSAQNDLKSAEIMSISNSSDNDNFKMQEEQIEDIESVNSQTLQEKEEEILQQ